MPFRDRDPRLLNVSIGSLVLLVILILWANQDAHCQEAPRDIAAKPSKVFAVAVGSYVSLAGMDAGITASCLAQARCAEANPVFKPFAGRPVTLAVTKMASSSALAWGVWTVRKRHPRLAWALVLSTAAVQASVDVANYRQLRRAR